MSKSKSPSPLNRRIQTYVDKYYGSKMNIVQIYPDPKVDNCYVIRFKQGDQNFACILNFNYEDYMIDDGIELEPKQKITKKMFGELSLF